MTSTPQQELAERLTWLSERVEAQHAWLWPGKDTAHDRVSCEDSDHFGCHIVAICELGRQAARALAVPSPAAGLRERIEQLPRAAIVSGGREMGVYDHGEFLWREDVLALFEAER